MAKKKTCVVSLPDSLLSYGMERKLGTAFSFLVAHGTSSVLCTCVCVVVPMLLYVILLLIAIVFNQGLGSPLLIILLPVLSLLWGVFVSAVLLFPSSCLLQWLSAKKITSSVMAPIDFNVVLFLVLFFAKGGTVDAAITSLVLTILFGGLFLLYWLNLNGFLYVGGRVSQLLGRLTGLVWAT